MLIQEWRNNTDLSTIKISIEEITNPLSDTIDKDTLYNIGTGKSPSDETAMFLLSATKTGSVMREKCVSECVNNRKRFKESILQQKLK